MVTGFPFSDFPYAWTSAWGEDEFGLWASFEYRGIEQRLRWIPPGKFMMGSPKTEPERYDDEIQHEVVLTQGFWLADTACTQELWEAVMGNNRSKFKGPDRPVENVSWEDCQEFFGRINQAVPGLDLRFPTEAQWEYACRAGTTTPFYFGDQVTPEQINYDGNAPYSGSEKGEYRRETVPVRSLPPNLWGLYEIHGNVYEWCSDWYGPYEPEKMVDPQGLDEGEYRVLRGGSWFDYAGYCRSAYRDGYVPGYRNEYIGFRLSRGQ